VQLHAGLLLQIADDTEQVSSLRIAAGSEHPTQAFRRHVSGLGQFLKSDSGLDIVAQYRFAGLDVTGKLRFCTSSLKPFGWIMALPFIAITIYFGISAFFSIVAA
jgi:hypothetical protein